MIYPPQRGFTLLIAVILSSVVLAIGLALLDISYKQLVLASVAKNSQYAFYAADSALECALYYDQQLGSFAYDVPPQVSPVSLPSISCAGQNSISVTQTSNAATSTATFSVPCSGGNSAIVQVQKGSGGFTAVYAYGYSVCSPSDPRRVERGLKVFY
jgi:Tfp pilus assembly protein PilE